MKTKVYIASPYTKGDVAVNVKRQLDAADELMTLGYAPFAPLYSHFQHMAHPRPYADWIAIDLEWVPACDVVLRMDGESSGADGEVAFARERGVPVVFSVAELRQCFPALGVQERWSGSAAPGVAAEDDFKTAVLRCRYPVCKTIHPSGWGWDTSRLNEVIADHAGVGAKHG